MSDDEDNRVLSGYGSHVDVCINGFMFCASHGREWCHVCCTDHRACNNIQFEDDLTEEQLEQLAEDGLEDLEDRQQLSVEGLWKTVQGNRAACKRHSSIGCSSCFDFKQQLLQLPDAAAAAAAAGGAASIQAAAAADSSKRHACWRCGAQKGSSTAAEGATTKLHRCSRCQRAKYCSRDCQVADYAEHKVQCKRWAQQRQEQPAEAQQ